MDLELQKLKYANDALEPHIDAQTMEIHHSKHHNAYTTNLNAAIAGTDLEGKSIEEILLACKDKPAVRNNGGGFWNHNLFWECMAPNKGGLPTGELAEAINSVFGSFEAFKELITRFPDSKYAPDSRLRMTYTVNSLAAHEVHVARYYYTKGAYVAAVNRAQAAEFRVRAIIPRHQNQRQGTQQQRHPGAQFHHIGFVADIGFVNVTNIKCSR